MNGSLGRFGEAWAVGMLTRRGYTVLERNVRHGQGEIDIVARDGNTLVFVEVKCRRTSAYGSPEEAITAARYARLADAISRYLEEHGREESDYRIDVVAIEVDRRGAVERGDLITNVESPSR